MELWDEILTLAVEIGPRRYEACSGITFLQLVRDWNSPVDRWNWRDLRLVCRLWSLILDPQWTPRIQARSPSDITTGKDIQTLYVLPDFFGDVEEIIQYPLDQRLINAAKNIHTIDILDLKGTFTTLLFEHSNYFPSLKALSSWRRDRLQSFWSGLQKFSGLVVLRILGLSGGHGNIYLPNLEILELDLFTLPTFTFPSLRHVSIRTYPSESYWDFLRGHSTTLASLLFYFYWQGKNVFDGQFWKNFPKLRLLGASYHIIEGMQPPPPTHPIDSLWFQKPTYLRMLSVEDVLGKIPLLRYLSFDSSYVSSVRMTEIRNLCEGRGISLIA